MLSLAYVLDIMSVPGSRKFAPIASNVLLFVDYFGYWVSPPFREQCYLSFGVSSSADSHSWASRRYSSSDLGLVLVIRQDCRRAFASISSGVALSM